MTDDRSSGRRLAGREIRPWLIIGLALFVAGLVLDGYWLIVYEPADLLSSDPIGVLSNLAVGLPLLFAVGLAACFPRWRTVFLTFGAVAVCVAAPFAMVGNLSIVGMTPVRNPVRYGKVLQELKGHPEAEWTEWVSHFPPTIPQSASEVRFYYRSRWIWRGANVIEVRYILPPDELIRVREAMYSNPTLTGPPGNGLDGREREFHIGPSDDWEAFDEQVYSGRGTVAGVEVYGIAISTSRNEILYWADSWR